MTNKDDISPIARGARLKQVRDAMDITGKEFADELNKAAAKLGLPHVKYTPLNVSQRETGRRELDIEDYTIVSYVDPEKRSWFWLAFGREIPNAMRIPREGRGRDRGTGT